MVYETLKNIDTAKPFIPIMSMKNLRMMTLPVVLLLSVVTAVAQKHTARIERVTVYTRGALVQRSQAVQLGSGEQTITFTGMSPYLDSRSLQVRATGRLTVLGVSQHTARPDSAAHAARLHQAEAALAAVDRRLQQVRDEQEVVEAQKELLKTNCSVGSRTVATPLAGIRELNTYYGQEMLSLKRKTQDLAAQLETLNEERTQKARVKDSLASVRLQTVTEVEVKVSTTQAGRATFNLSYYVDRASWYPSYDVRSDGTQAPLQLSYKANIRQNSGEQWQGVSVVLSSASPNRSNTAPQIGTYWLEFEPEYRPARARGHAAANRVMAAPMEMVQMRVAEDVAMAEEEDAEEESTVQAVTQRQAPFGYEFAIQAPLTLPADNSVVTTELARHELPATYIYKAYPKHDSQAFLMADATGWQQLNLLQGQATVFFDNAYVGKSTLDPTVSSDTLRFSLGRDPGITLQRTKITDSSTRRFLGSNQEQTMAWRITVKNLRQQPVNLMVYDQVPVARSREINVSVEQLSNGSLDSDTGIVTWQLDLQPGEQRELLLEYKVKYPKNRRLTIE